MDDVNSTSPNGPSFALEDAIEILDRRKLWIILATLVGIAIGIVAYVVLPPAYSARTTILVEPQEVPEKFIPSTITVSAQQRLATLRERVTSYANLNELIDRVGQQRLDPNQKLTREELMNLVRRNVRVETKGKFSKTATGVFVISFQGTDPEVVADVTREISALFISENLKARAQQVTATADFLDRELKRFRNEVSAKEEEIRIFKQERMGSLPSQLTANLRALDRLNSQLASNLDSQVDLSARIALFREQIAREPAKGSDESNRVRTALQRTEAKLLEAEQVYTEEHPSVKSLQAQAERLRAELESLTASHSNAGLGGLLSGVHREYDRMQLEQNKLARQEEQIRDQINGLEERVAVAPKLEQELATLTRDYDNISSTYRRLLNKKFDAELAKNLEHAQKGERFRVLIPAKIPRQPSWPDLSVLIPMGLAGSLGLTALLILFTEIRNPAFRSVNRLARNTGLPVVASIPRIDSDEIYETPPTGDVDPRLVVYTAPESAPAEQYRSFVPLFLENPDTRVVLVTSAQRGDGKSLTCMNLALTVASDLNRKVLVIDGDLRRPTTHRLLRVRRNQGLCDVLEGRLGLQQCAVNSKIPNLSVLPAGAPVRNPLALITSKAFIETIREAKKHYDAVFIDSPPLLPVVDTRILKQMADIVLFVVRADATPREAAVRSMSELKSIAGLVFNEVSTGSFRRYYYHDAYARYVYGEPNEAESGKIESTE